MLFSVIMQVFAEITSILQKLFSERNAISLNSTSWLTIMHYVLTKIISALQKSFSAKKHVKGRCQKHPEGGVPQIFGRRLQKPDTPKKFFEGHVPPLKQSATVKTPLNFCIRTTLEKN